MPRGLPHGFGSTTIDNCRNKQKKENAKLKASIKALDQRMNAMEEEYAEMKANVDMLKGLTELQADIEAFKS